MDQTQKWLISCVGIDVEEPPRCVTFCDYVVTERKTLVVPNALDDPRFADNPLVTGALGVRFYAGAPLIDSNGRAVGTLCVLDRQPRADLNAAQRQTLEDLAQMAIDRIELHLRNHEAHKAAGRMALQSEILRLVLEAADFTTACTDAMEYLRATTDALYCRLFRLAPNGVNVDFVAGAGKGNRNDDTARTELLSARVTVRNSAVGHALSSGEQIVLPDLKAIDPTPTR